MSRTAGVLLFVVASFAVPLPAQDATSLFNEGVDLLRRGRDEEALMKFQGVLALDPSREDAYQLFTQTEHAIWLQMLVKGGEWERISKRIMDLASIERRERQDDATEIAARIEEIKTGDLRARRNATLRLSAEHGEYAVPYLVRSLASMDDPEFRVTAMHVLVEMGGDAVLPLRETLRSDNEALRRASASILGRIGDRRAVPALRVLAEGDPVATVKAAAAEALAAIRAGSGNSVAAFVEQGEAYLARNPSVLREIDWSDVVWSWEGGRLVAHPVPRAFYAYEIARQAFHDALALDPGTAVAMAGIAYSYAAPLAELEALRASAADLSAIEAYVPFVEAGRVPMLAAGPEILDGALRHARTRGDAAVSVALLDAMGEAGSVSAGAVDALSDEDRRVRYSAAIALATALPRGGFPGSETVGPILAEVVEQEVVRIAQLIDERADRRERTGRALEAAGFFVVPSPGGLLALPRLRRFPGVDLVAVSATLQDLTPDQLIDEVREDFRTSGVPIVVLAEEADASRAEELYGAKVQRIVSQLDAATASEVVSERLNADRERTLEIAHRAAHALEGADPEAYGLARLAGTIAGALARHSAEVNVPLLLALSHFAGAAEVAPIASILADGARAADERVAAATALGAVLARTGASPAEAFETLLAAAKEGDLAVRTAAAAALGRCSLGLDARAGVLHDVRTDLRPGGGDEMEKDGGMESDGEGG